MVECRVLLRLTDCRLVVTVFIERRKISFILLMLSSHAAEVATHIHLALATTSAYFLFCSDCGQFAVCFNICSSMFAFSYGCVCKYRRLYSCLWPFHVVSIDFIRCSSIIRIMRMCVLM